MPLIFDALFSVQTQPRCKDASNNLKYSFYFGALRLKPW